MRRAAALFAVLALTGCGADKPPDVSWAGVPSNERVVIEEAISADDCAAMQAHFDGTEATDVLKYLDWHLRDAGCYE